MALDFLTKRWSSYTVLIFAHTLFLHRFLYTSTHNTLHGFAPLHVTITWPSTSPAKTRMNSEPFPQCKCNLGKKLHWSRQGVDVGGVGMQTDSCTQLSSRLVNLQLQHHQCQTDSLPFILASCKSNESLVNPRNYIPVTVWEGNLPSYSLISDTANCFPPASRL